jgi:orotidine-5'-phosphate decarboxylase
MSNDFADRIIEGARAAGAPLCVGLDPDVSRIPALFGDGAAKIPGFCQAMLEEAAKAGVAAVKPQLGYFEAHGAAGYAAAELVCAEAARLRLPIILDAKRGDIGATAEGYAASAYDNFGADAVTVNPYMGLDTLEPFLSRAQARGKGVAVLVRTSNPGAKDFQDLDVNGAPLWTRVAEALAPAAARLMGASGWSGLMMVAGATYPEEARRLRDLAPTALFLVPGYGAQGAGAKEALAGFVQGPRGREGGVVNASRSLLYPPGAERAKTLAEWRGLIAQAIAAAKADLASAL